MNYTFLKICGGLNVFHCAQVIYFKNVYFASITKKWVELRSGWRFCSFFTESKGGGWEQRCVVFTPRSVGVFEKSKIYKFFLSPLSSLSFLLCFFIFSCLQNKFGPWFGGGGDKLRRIKAWCFELNCNDCVCVVKVWWDKRRISSNSASWAGNSAAKGPGYDTVNCFLLITLMWVLRVKFVGSSPG